MTEIVLALLCGALLLGILTLVARQDVERRQWAKERTAMLERCVPGLVLQPTAGDEAPTPAYGTDSYEWTVQEARRRASGLSDDVI